MAKASSIFVNIGADTSEFRKGLQDVQKAMKGALGGEALSVSNAAVGVLAGVAAGISYIGIKALYASGQMEQYKVAFTTMLGGADKAKAKMDEMEKFAANTPFSLESVVQGTQRLLAMGFAAKDTQTVLTAAGDASAGLGKGEEGIERITLALGQMNAKGKVSAEEMKQLTELGVNGWQYLADSQGKSVQEVMKMAESGALGSGEAIKAILEGMNGQFGGLMEAQRNTLFGAMGAIEDSVAQTMSAVGDSLNSAFNISGTINWMADQLQIFKGIVKESGISEAFRQMIPPEIALGFFALAGVILAVAVPAFITMGIAAASAAAGLLVTLGPVIAVGAAVGAAFYLIWQSGVDLSGVFKLISAGVNALWQMFKPTVDKLVQAFQAILPVFMDVAKVLMVVVFAPIGVALAVMGAIFYGVLTAMAWLFEWVAGIILDQTQLFVSAWDWGMEMIVGAFDWVKSIMPGWVTDMLAWIWKFVGPAIDAINKVVDALGKVFGGKKSTGSADFKKSEDTNTQNEKTQEEKVKEMTLNSGGGGGSKGGGSKAKGPDPVKEAQKISKEISEAWRDSYQSTIGAHNDWYQKTLENLNKYKASNTNYAQDLTRLEETEAAKRVKIVRDQVEGMEDAYRSLYRSVEDMGVSSKGMNLQGGEKLKFEIESNYENELRGITDFLKSASDAKYEAEESLRKAKASGDAGELQRAQAHYDAMAGLEVAAKEKANEKLNAVELKKQEEQRKLTEQGLLVKADMQKAYDNYDIEGYMTHLSDKNALLLSSLEGAQEYMNVYQEMQMEANRSTVSYMAEAYKTLYDGLSSSLTDVIMGVKSASEAFKSLGKTMIGMLAEWVAKRIAAILLGSAMEKSAAVAQMAMAKATGTAVAASWASAAAMVSLATMGSNAAPAMAGIGTTVGFATGLAIPMLASGGIATGATLAIIGEGKDKEAVMPLNRNVLAPIFGDAMDYAGGGTAQTTATVQIYGDIGKESTVDEVQEAMMWALRNAKGG